MIHPDDEAVIRRITGLSKTPEAVEREYDIRAGMYHRGGGSGPLGILSLIALVRSLNIGPPKLTAAEQVVQWGQLATDGTVIVEVHRRDHWQRGQFKGFGTMNQLLVEFDGDPMIRAYPKGVVRLYKPPRVVEPKPDIAKPEVPPTPGKPLEPGPATDWAAVSSDARVFVGSDMLDGKFVGVSEDKSTVFVKVEGDESSRPFPASEVELV